MVWAVCDAVVEGKWGTLHGVSSRCSGTRCSGWLQEECRTCTVFMFSGRCLYSVESEFWYRQEARVSQRWNLEPVHETICSGKSNSYSLLVATTILKNSAMAIVYIIISTLTLTLRYNLFTVSMDFNIDGMVVTNLQVIWINITSIFLG